MGKDTGEPAPAGWDAPVGSTVKVTVELDLDMYNDLQWFVDHFKDQLNQTTTVAKVMIDLIEDVIDIWSAEHSNTGYCAMCHYEPIAHM